MAGPASAEGYEAVFGSPALLAETHEKSLTLGYAVARLALREDTASRTTGPNAGPNAGRNASRTAMLGTDEMKSLVIGAALPLPFQGALRNRVTLGMGFLEPAQFLVRGKILYPERLQYPIVAPRVQSLAIVLGLGVRLFDRLYVGAGYEALAAVIGEIVISVDSTAHVSSRTDDQVVAAYAPIVSAAYDVGEHFRIGATYRGELIGRFVITIKAQDLGLNLPDFNVAGLAQYDPAQVGAEVRWSSNGNRGPFGADARAVRVVVGLLGRRWSKYPGPSEPTVLANPSYGTGSPQIGAKDTVSPRLGVEQAFPIGERAGVRVRAGYAYEPTPLPPQTGRENLLDSTRHVVTAGVGVAVDAPFPFRLDLFTQLHLLESRVHEKSSDTAPSVTSVPSDTSVTSGTSGC
ncbi:MAG: hypothetical protein NVSMB1_13680 [Polyangiales bacterium]